MKNTFECEEDSPHNDSTFLSSYLSLLKDTYFSIIDIQNNLKPQTGP